MNFIVFDYPVIVSLIGAILVGFSAGIISCYAVLKEQSLLGDAIAHAALPGICIAFLITLNKTASIIMSGALFSGILGMLFITTIIRKSILKEDTALGVILSVFFGIGTLLLTIIQKIPTARQAGLDSYLFGNAASILIEEVKIIGIVSLIIFVVTLLCWKEFKIIIFDSNHAKSQGFSTTKLEFVLTLLIVVAIIIGLQIVGVILMSAIIIAPAVAAKQWQSRLSLMMILSVIFSILSCTIGVLISSTINQLPTGPSIVVITSIFVLASILISPKGIITKKIHETINKHQIRKESILSNLYLLAKTHKDHTHPHNIKTLSVLGTAPTQKLLNKLKKKNLIYQKDTYNWGLTPEGVNIAVKILQRVH